MSETYFKPGDFARICDITGFKVKASQTRKRWDKMIVRKESWEPRHPQDLLRSRPDRQQVPDPRSESTDVFIAEPDERFTTTADRRVDSAGDTRIATTGGTNNVRASDL